MEANDGSFVDPSVQKLIEARDRSAVLKHNLIALRAELQDAIIFVFEGSDDKSVYYAWSRRIRPELVYEPLVCKGKDRVLALRDAAMRDESGLAHRVYFFVDRDFEEGDVGFVDGNLFVTDRYSVENYLVCPEVLEEILKIEYHMDGEPAMRADVLNVFQEVYAKFLDEMRSINERLFVARRAKIRLAQALPDKIRLYACVTLKGAAAIALPTDVVVMEREPSGDEVTSTKMEFSSLCPSERFRGKFALAFFDKWLDLLADDRRAENSVLFPGVSRNLKISRQGISLMTLAMRSPMPTALDEFMRAVEA